MRTSQLLRRNLSYYWPSHLAVVLGVATAVAVLTGALMVGDSVRASLRQLLLNRLGATDQVVTVSSYCREQFAEDLESHSQFAAHFRAACPLISLEGMVTHQESRRRASDVLVYGVDDRFWTFHEQPGNGRAPKEREALLSPSLAQELGASSGDSLLLRVEKPSAIPAEFLHGRRDDQGHILRLSLNQVLNSLGEFSVRPQQGTVRALFISLRRLQKELQLENKVNTILIAERKDGQSWQEAKSQLEKLIQQTGRLEDLGIKLRVLKEQQCLALESESTLVNRSLEQVARTTANELGLQTSSILTYLANVIRSGAHEVPYSLVTAMDRESLSRLETKEEMVSAASSNEFTTPKDRDIPSLPPPIFLNDWTARDLGVRPGAEVSLDYYVWLPEGQLVTRTAQFRLHSVLRLRGITTDRDLVPQYPGITGSDNLSDWDPPFPMDLGRIRPRDEAYWHQYRTTPKAYIPLEVGQELWQSRFGRLSSLRIFSKSGTSLDSILESYQQKLGSALNPLQFGFAVYAARGQGLEASRGATDFGEYFLYFSFVLVGSALLLTSLFFKLGIEQRLREIGLLQALGFPRSRIGALFLSEGLVLTMLGTMAGLAGAVAYGKFIMWGLGHWWTGAVGTTRLALYLSPRPIGLGALGGFLTATVCIAWTLRSLAARSPRSLLSGAWGTERPGNGESAKRRIGETASLSALQVKDYKPGGMRGEKNCAQELRSPHSLFLRFVPETVALTFGLSGALLLLGASFKWLSQAAGFFGAGASLLIASLFLERSWLNRGHRKLLHGRGWWGISRLGFRNTADRSGRSVLCIALIASATFIIVSIDAFRRDSSNDSMNPKAGSGGYPLLAEALLPLHYDLNTPRGRENLNLDAQSDAMLAQVVFSRFRVRPGDDISCLNLYQARNPRILGAAQEFIKSNRFAFQDSLAGSPAEKTNPWLLLNQETTDGTIPIVADANSITYVLHRRLGDIVELNLSSEHPIRLRLVAALADSLFQSELLMSENNFIRLFPSQQGYRFFLLETSKQHAAAVTGILEDRLSDFGFDVVATSERLAGFHKVENTYLSTFQSLGGLGLILGTMGLAAVLLRNVLERRRELALLQAVGYTRAHLALMIVAENLLLLVCGLLIGTFCALVAIAPSFLGRGSQLPILSIAVLLAIVLTAGMAASVLATLAALRSPLLPALRGE